MFFNFIKNGTLFRVLCEILNFTNSTVDTCSYFKKCWFIRVIGNLGMGSNELHAACKA